MDSRALFVGPRVPGTETHSPQTAGGGGRGGIPERTHPAVSAATGSVRTFIAGPHVTPDVTSLSLAPESRPRVTRTHTHRQTRGTSPFTRVSVCSLWPRRHLLRPPTAFSSQARGSQAFASTLAGPRDPSIHPRQRGGHRGAGRHAPQVRPPRPARRSHRRAAPPRPVAFESPSAAAAAPGPSALSQAAGSATLCLLGKSNGRAHCEAARHCLYKTSTQLAAAELQNGSVFQNEDVFLLTFFRLLELSG